MIVCVCVIYIWHNWCTLLVNCDYHWTVHYTTNQRKSWQDCPCVKWTERQLKKYIYILKIIMFCYWWRFLVTFCDWWCFVTDDVLWGDVFLLGYWWRFVGWHFVRRRFVRWRFVGASSVYMAKRKILIRKATVDAGMEGWNKALDERGETLMNWGG